METEQKSEEKPEEEETKEIEETESKDTEPEKGSVAKELDEMDDAARKAAGLD